MCTVTHCNLLSDGIASRSFGGKFDNQLQALQLPKQLSRLVVRTTTSTTYR